MVRNRQWFSDLSGYKATWELVVDGVVAKKGKLTVPKIAADSSAKVEIPVIIPHEANEVFFSDMDIGSRYIVGSERSCGVVGSSDIT